MKKEEKLRRESKSSIVKHNDRIYFNDEWNTESPTDDDEEAAISDEDGMRMVSIHSLLKIIKL